MNSRFAPVAVFTYNRLDHTKRVLDALDLSALAPETDLFVFCDNYKSENARGKVEEVRDYVDKFKQTCRFRKIEVIKAEKNKGLARSIIDGVTIIMNDYGKAIVVEDDMLASRHFLEFMNSGLDYYKDNPVIWSISGYTFPMEALKEYPHDIYMSGRGSCWGWASWADRWQLVDWEVSDYKSYQHNWTKRHRFAQWGKDLPLMLDTQMYTNHNSWAIRWCYSQFKHGMKTVYPKISYIQNIGNDGTGTHKSNLKDKYETTLEDKDMFECTFEDLPYDKRIMHEFSAKYYAGTRLYLKTQLKWFLARVGLLKPDH